jgi:beta-lactamase regulating signal transducer with metallopeptidase domain
MAYPFGIIIMLLYYVVGYIIFAKTHRRRYIEAQASEIAMLSEICGNKKIPFLFRNPLAATPMLMGAFRPAIILPDKEYSDAQLRAVLLHELTHLRRKDVLVKWLSVFVTAVHWFNPIVWFMRREIDRACELACDETVIRNFDTNGKQSYGETLIFVAADSKTPHAVLSTTMCEEKKALKERLCAIMKSKKHTRLAIVLSVALILAVGGLAIALGAGR